MRSLLLILFFASIVACSGPERTTRGVSNVVDDMQAPSGTSVLFVETSRGPDSAFKSAARAIQSHGYGIENSDAELQSLTSTWRTVSSGFGPSVSTRISAGVIRQSPTTIRLSGRYDSGGFSPASIEKSGQSGSATRTAWAELLTVAHKVSKEVNGEIQFR